MEHVTDGCTCEGKKCAKCENVKCIGYFSLLKGKYRRNCCRKCESERLAEWNRNNRTKRQEYHQKWRENNPERYKASIRRYNQSHLAKQAQRRHKGAHPKKEEQRKKPGYWVKYEAGYKEKRLQWRKNNHETVRVNHIRYRARKKLAPGDFTVQEWEALKARYDYTCLCCGRKESEIKLTADHIMPLVLGGANFIDNIQPLCLSCNLRKHAKFIDFRPKTP